MTYQLKLPKSLKAIHSLFHVSQLRKYILEESYVLKYEPIQIDQKLMYEEQPITIMDWKV